MLSLWLRVIVTTVEQTQRKRCSLIITSTLQLADFLQNVWRYCKWSYNDSIFSKYKELLHLFLVLILTCICVAVCSDVHVLSFFFKWSFEAFLRFCRSLSWSAAVITLKDLAPENWPVRKDQREEKKTWDSKCLKCRSVSSVVDLPGLILTWIMDLNSQQNKNRVDLHLRGTI